MRGSGLICRWLRLPRPPGTDRRRHAAAASVRFWVHLGWPRLPADGLVAISVAAPAETFCAHKNAAYQKRRPMPLARRQGCRFPKLSCSNAGRSTDHSESNSRSIRVTPKQIVRKFPTVLGIPPSSLSTKPSRLKQRCLPSKNSRLPGPLAFRGARPFAFAGAANELRLRARSSAYAQKFPSSHSLRLRLTWTPVYMRHHQQPPNDPIGRC